MRTDDAEPLRAGSCPCCGERLVSTHPRGVCEVVYLTCSECGFLYLNVLESL
jgi:hypothetical protein